MTLRFHKVSYTCMHRVSLEYQLFDMSLSDIDKSDASNYDWYLDCISKYVLIYAQYVSYILPCISEAFIRSQNIFFQL